MPTARTNIGSCVMAGSVVQPHTHAGASCTHSRPLTDTDAHVSICVTRGTYLHVDHATTHTYPTFAAVAIVYRVSYRKSVSDLVADKVAEFTWRAK